MDTGQLSSIFVWNLNGLLPHLKKWSTGPCHLKASRGSFYHNFRFYDKKKSSNLKEAIDSVLWGPKIRRLWRGCSISSKVKTALALDTALVDPRRFECFFRIFLFPNLMYTLSKCTALIYKRDSMIIFEKKDSRSLRFSSSTSGVSSSHGLFLIWFTWDLNLSFIFFFF